MRERQRQVALIVAAVAALIGLGLVGAHVIGRRAAGAGVSPTVARFAGEPRVQDAIVFLGDSLTAEGPWAALFRDAGPVLNRGNPGDTTGDVLTRLDEVTARKPRAIILMIGTNDLLRGSPIDAAVANVGRIFDRIRLETPASALTLLAIPPAVEAADPYFAGFVARSQRYNARLRALAAARSLQFLDYTASFVEQGGQLRSDLTEDGLHLRHAGYALLSQLLRRDVPVLGAR